ncbi:MAG: pitrilysin family protein [Proteobacteria bacterium]|nr:pitrilysin family protein [Pseudomonadota bacterium]
MIKHRLLFAVLLLLFNATAFAAPAIQHWETKNGARVYFVPAPELPMVDVRVAFDAGSARDGDTPGLAALTSNLLSDGAEVHTGTGAGELNADEIADRFAGLGAHFGAGAGRDMTSVSLRSLSRPDVLQPALDTAAALVQRPSFPATGFERERDRTRVALRAQEQSPGDIAGKAFYQAVYGAHPYGTEPAGTEASLNRLTRDDLVAFHKRYYAGRNAIIAVVGALSRNEAAAVAETIIGGLPAGAAATALPKVGDLASAQMIQIKHPSAQTHVLLGQPGLSRIDPDYFPLLVGNHILGGSGLVSRLTDEVREKRGLSYSAYSYFLPLREPGPFTLGLQTRNEQTGQALKVLRDTLQTFTEHGPSAQELKAAKQNITGGFALRIDSNSKLIEYLALIGFYNLPLGFLDTYSRHVEKITLEQVRAAFRRRINPEQMVTVVVGGGAAASQD